MPDRGTRRWLWSLVLSGALAVLVAAARPRIAVAVLLAYVLAAAYIAQRTLAAVHADRGAVARRLEGSRDRRSSELATERTRIERLLERLPIAVLLFTPTGLAYANPEARELFPGAQETGRSPLRVLTHTALAGAVAEARASGRSVHVELDHDQRYLAARALVTAEGEVALVVTDQTEARRIEMVRRDFVINASHELKTPVASMQALADTIETALQRDPDRVPAMAEQVRIEAVRMGQLVRDLLDLARLEEHSAERRDRVDVSAVMHQEAQRLHADAAARQVEVTVEVQDDVILVAVPEDVQVIVGNLLENAVRYNRPGGRVLARVQRVDDTVLIEVIDTGLGMADAERMRIFERFYRVDRARSRAEGGTGLGLAIVRHAAQTCGGEVSVESVLGEGSTFRVVLPIAGAAIPGS